MKVLNIFQRFLIIVLTMDIDCLLISSIRAEFMIINQTVTADCLQCDGLQSDSNRILVGSNVNLSCQSSSAYRYCTWEHADKECSFEWTRVCNIPVNSIMYHLNLSFVSLPHISIQIEHLIYIVLVSQFH